MFRPVAFSALFLVACVPEEPTDVDAQGDRPQEVPSHGDDSEMFGSGGSAPIATPPSPGGSTGTTRNQGGAGGASHHSGGHHHSSGGTVSAGSGGDLQGTGGVGTGGADPLARVGDCKESSYVDHTASDSPRSLSWTLAIGENPSRCMKIRVNQAVTWNGNFTMHPLETYGGCFPNPIETKTSGTGVASTTFSSPGRFGYICGIHVEMQGAIWVVP